MIATIPGGVAPQQERIRNVADGVDGGLALGHVRRLGIPRRVGTPGERQAVREILRAFAACGLSRRVERFPVPFAAREWGTRLALAASAAAILLGAATLASRPLASAACWAAALFLVNLPWRAGTGRARRWPTRLHSRNLVATAADPAGGEAPARVVFLAHYDSKSQPLPTGVRVGLVVAANVCGVALAALALAASAGGSDLGHGPGPAVLSGVALAVLAVLTANVTGNASPGALDNATGVAGLLELARTWRPRPGAPVEAVWVATGAEEVGLVGARDFLRRHEAWLRERPTLLINLDTVGTGDRVYLSGSPGALRLAGEAADASGISWSRLRVLGAYMDHEPFAARGLEAVSLLGDVVGCSLALHSPRDVAARVDPRSIERAGRLAARLAWAWAERHATCGDVPGEAGRGDPAPRGRTRRGLRPRRRTWSVPGRPSDLASLADLGPSSSQGRT